MTSLAAASCTLGLSLAATKTASATDTIPGISQSACVKEVTSGSDQILSTINGPQSGSVIIKLSLRYGDNNPIFTAIKNIVQYDIQSLSADGYETTKHEVPSQANESCQVLRGSDQEGSAEPSNGSPADVANFNHTSDSFWAICQDFQGWQRLGGHISDPGAVEDQPFQAEVNVFTGYSGGGGWGSNPGLEIGFGTEDGLASPGPIGGILYQVDIYQNRQQERGGLINDALVLDIDHTESQGWTATAVKIAGGNYKGKRKTLPVSAIDVEQSGVSAVFPIFRPLGLEETVLLDSFRINR